MTKLLEDIWREPQQIARSLTYTLGEGQRSLAKAAQILRDADHIALSGMGSSLYAAMAPHATFLAHGRPVGIYDAAELLHFSEIPRRSAVVLLSRSGKSIEITRLITKFRENDTKVIGITNTLDSPLAMQADVVLPMTADFDHRVSISMYSTLAMTATLLALETVRKLDCSVAQQLQESLTNTASALQIWKTQFESQDFIESDAPTYFLARGPSVASCHEARLLWEEAAKAPATAMTTGTFRHGPLEFIRPQVRIGLWIDSEKMRKEDLALARDLREQGANVLVIGQKLPANAGDLVVNLPNIAEGWQFLIDIIPVQVAAEQLSRRRGENCDAFRFCSYIVEAEGGLNGEAARKTAP